MAETITDLVRNALLAGESLSATDVMERFGASNSMLAATKKTMEKGGYRFKREQDNDGPVRWRLAREGERASRSTKRATQSKSSAKSKPPKSKPPKSSNSKHAPVTVVAEGFPGLAETLTVHGFALLDDGSVSVMLVGEDGTPYDVALLEQV